ncbi:MAG: tetratricopeptide repeat protein [Brevinematales bacterium]|nr:tetratricopeptide repeat protein [Brevinematales bacterium]
MQIQKLQPSDFPPARETTQQRVSSQVPPLLPMREKTTEIQPMVMHREMIEKFSEWYLRMGKAYESTKSYRQAISAYEKSYAVSPAFSKAASIESLRGKIIEK